jgi:GTP-binding protein YchF
MSLSIGIVGLPNVGKSTLFNALLKRQAALAANYPFATIEPNVGVVDVPDPRLEKLAEFVRNDYGRTMGDKEVPEKIIPATVKFYDIAGLVKGASQGEGLGNEFLGHIRDVDVIVHLVKVFKDENVVETGSGDPQEDIEIINTELILSDLQSITNQMKKIEGDAKRSNDKEAARKYEIYTKIKETLEKGEPARSLVLSKNEHDLIKGLFLLTFKPAIYTFNVSEDQISTPTDQEELIERYDGVKISAKIESDIGSLDSTEQHEYLKELGILSGTLDKVIERGYKLLNLDTYFTAGPKEVRAWSFIRGSKAPQAAGIIHTDFERGFISAEVINYIDLEKIKSTKKAKEKGMIRLEGREYVVKDGDVILYRFNV